MLFDFDSALTFLRTLFMADFEVCVVTAFLQRGFMFASSKYLKSLATQNYFKINFDLKLLRIMKVI